VQVPSRGHVGSERRDSSRDHDVTAENDVIAGEVAARTSSKRQLDSHNHTASASPSGTIVIIIINIIVIVSGS